MSVTEDIKSRLDIVSVVSQYVPELKKAGRTYKAPCPFHSERTPSFVVSPDTQSWRCFGACAEGGDIFSFVMKHEGLDFVAALRLLADKAGVTLEEHNPKQNADHDKHLDRLRGLLHETAQFFHEKLLNARDADHARAYAHKRGLSGSTITQFMIGYAPDAWRSALDHLTRLGYDEAEIIEAGVAKRNEEKDRVYDVFRNRLVIPICDGKGQVIGFGARILNPEDNPKYLNSPQTPLFDKSATLFGLNFARRAIRETETAVIVEGYMDAVQAHQGGFTNVVAQMGTALTEPQLKQLSRYAKRLILALDPDEAGVKATIRGLEVARKVLGDSKYMFDPRAMMRQSGKLGIEILVMTMPDGQDPDDLIRDEPERWQTLVSSAQPVADYVIAVGTEGITPASTLGEREQIARDLLPVIMATEDSLQQNYNIQRLALKLRLDERMLRQIASAQTSKAVRTQPVPAKLAEKPQRAAETVTSNPVLRLTQNGVVMEQLCLAVLLNTPDQYYVVNRRLRGLATEANLSHDSLGPLSVKDFSRADYQAIFELFSLALAQDEQEPVEYLEQHIPYHLSGEVEKLRTEVMDDFARRLRPSMHAELAYWRKEQIRTAERPDEKLLLRILELRKERLRRENQELQFLQQDTDIQAGIEYAHYITLNRKAIGVLDVAINQAISLQRE